MSNPSIAAARRPLCFVLMPFGSKPDAGGRTVHFDALYKDVFCPAVERAGMEPLRADEEVAGGIIHKALFERLVLCEYAIADLTLANANVYYELGLRHGVRPASTLLVFASGSRLPFDVAPLRALSYELRPDGHPADVDSAVVAIANRLHDARTAVPDSPVFQLIEGMRGQEIDRLKTDTFRDRVEISEAIRTRLRDARTNGVEAVRSVRDSIAGACPLRDAEAGVLIDLLLSFRAVSAWDDMIQLVADISAPVAETVLVQEQLALALNRVKRSEQAEAIIVAVIEQHGPSSESLGILGRIYKDRWDTARQGGQLALARGLLEKAIDAYRRGFEADWRDAYPGINAVTLMELRQPPDARRQELLPLVRYAVKRRTSSGPPDYWDYATLLELAVLGTDQGEADTHLAAALASAREGWELLTTARNIGLIRQAREATGDDSVPWIASIEGALLSRKDDFA